MKPETPLYTIRGLRGRRAGRLSQSEELGLRLLESLWCLATARNPGSRLLLLGNAALAISLLMSCQSSQPHTDLKLSEHPRPELSLFTDVSQAVGLDFTHFNGMSGEYYFCEMMGPGGALFDYDNDGDLDLYLVQGQMLGPDKKLEDALFPPHSSPAIRDRLYRNDLAVGPDGRRTLRFVEVTEESGIDSQDYGMGVAAGDFNNDGWVDLYVTNFGSNQLFRNNGDKTFTDMTGQTGTDDTRWSTSAAFLDFDRDGWLDLYVCNYVDYRYANHKKCYSPSGAQDYCAPLSYKAEPDRLFRNQGDGSFEDVSAKSQIAREYGSGLGVVSADFNGDGWIDIYVANDQMANQCWINQRAGRFKNEALLGGSAFNQGGRAEASMGVDAADFDADGDEDLFMTHLTDETNTVYVNDGNAFFEDYTSRSGLGTPSLPYTGFGTAWFDYDNDGWLDILTLNGAVKTIETLAAAGDPFPLHLRNQLFRNLGRGRFEDISSSAGAVFELSEVSRGAAFGDVDNDGDLDVLVLNNNGRARLLMNNVGQQRHWLGLRLVLKAANRDALGARVGVVRPQGPTLWRRARSDASYCSANDPRVLVGLGDGNEVTAVQVRWPSGTTEEWTGLPIDAYSTLYEGTGRVLEEQ